MGNTMLFVQVMGFPYCTNDVTMNHVTDRIMS